MTLLVVAKTPWDKTSDLSGIREELARMFDEGARDPLLDLVLSLLGQMAAQNGQLAWKLQAALRQLYTKKSERISPDQLALFLSLLTTEQAALVDPPASPEPEPPDAPVEPAKPAPKAKTPHKKPFPDDLRREVRYVPVPDALRRCDTCGGTKQAMGYDVRETWEMKPAEFFIIEERLEKCACKTCQDGVVTAEGTAKPIDGGRPGPGLLAQIVTSRFNDSCPLYRQSQIYKRSGITLSPSTLGDWCGFTGDILEPIWKRLRDDTLGCYLISLDDTGMPVLDREHPGGIKRGHVWTYIGDENRSAFCEYTPNWKGEAPRSVLAGFTGKVIQGDGYAGINEFFRKVDPPIRAGCMDHCRRKWVAALDAGDPRAAIAIALIAKVYVVEAGARRDGADLDELLRRRQDSSRPVMLQLQRVVADLHASALPKSPLGKATTYAINQWSTLIVFLDDPRVPLSNAHVERHQRRTALNRKNSLFAGSDEGARRLAILQSIVINCELHGVSMFDYVRDVVAKLAAGWPNSRIDELLPAAWLAGQKREQAEAQQLATAVGAAGRSATPLR